jgi:hypothetical protein
MVKNQIKFYFYLFFQFVFFTSVVSLIFWENILRKVNFLENICTGYIVSSAQI